MFANSFCATVDACVLAKSIERDILLNLRDAELFRVVWSPKIIEESERAIAKILKAKGRPDFKARAARVAALMQQAFPDAMVSCSERFLSAVPKNVDAKDHHVVATALASQSHVIVTDNLKDFPQSALDELGLEVKSTDQFIADAIELEPKRASHAIHAMLKDWNRPKLKPYELPFMLEAKGLVETASALLAL